MFASGVSILIFAAFASAAASGVAPSPLPLHRDAAGGRPDLARREPGSWTRCDAWVTHNIAFLEDNSNLYDFGRALLAADVDGDGDKDVVVSKWTANPASPYWMALNGLRWLENVDATGTAWAEHDLAPPDLAHEDSQTNTAAAAAADVDGDGDTDIVRITGLTWYKRQDIYTNCRWRAYNVTWHENMDGTGLRWAHHVVVSAAGAQMSDDCRQDSDALDNTIPTVVVVDVDGDADLDIVVPVDWDPSKVGGAYSWFENQGGRGASWTGHSVTSWRGISLFGFFDMLAVGPNLGAVLSSVDDPDTLTIFFCPSVAKGCGPYLPTSEVRIASTPAIEGGRAHPGRVTVADMDGDGYLDVLTLANNRVRWYSDGGSVTVPDWAAHDVESGGAALDVDVVDMDGDGDMDVVLGRSTGVDWSENVNGHGTQWALHALATSANQRAMAVADVDGDGMLDVLTLSHGVIAGNSTLARHYCAAPVCVAYSEPRLPHGCVQCAAPGANTSTVPECCTAGTERNTSDAALSCVLCAAGSFSSGVGDTCRQCPFPANCPGDGQCLAGTGGHMCVLCLSDYYMLAGTCRQCPHVSVLTLLLGLPAFALVSSLLHLGVLTPASLRLFRELATYLQTLALHFSVDVPWPDRVRQVGEYARILYADVGLLAPQCFVPINWHARLLLMLGAVTAVALIALAAYACLGWCARRTATAARVAGTPLLHGSVQGDAVAASPRRADALLGRQHQVASLTATFAVLVYVPLLRMLLDSFQCRSTDHGAVLVHDTSIRCASAAHVLVMEGSGLMSAALIFAVPILLFVRIRKLKHERSMRTSREGHFLRALYEPYRSHFPYMEVVVLARKATSVAVAVLVPSGAWQSCLLMALSTAYLFVAAWYRPWQVMRLRVGCLEVSNALNRGAIGGTAAQVVTLAAGLAMDAHGSPGVRTVGTASAAVAYATGAVFMLAWLQFVLRRRSAGSDLPDEETDTQQLGQRLQALVAAGDYDAATALAQERQQHMQNRLNVLGRRETHLESSMKQRLDGLPVMAAMKELDDIRRERTELGDLLTDPATQIRLLQLKDGHGAEVARAEQQLSAAMGVDGEGDVLAALEGVRGAIRAYEHELHLLHDTLVRQTWVQDALNVVRELHRLQQLQRTFDGPTAAHERRSRRWVEQVRSAAAVAEAALLRLFEQEQEALARRDLLAARELERQQTKVLQRMKDKARAAGKSAHDARNFWAMQALRQEYARSCAVLSCTYGPPVRLHPARPDFDALEREVTRLRQQAMHLAMSTDADRQAQVEQLVHRVRTVCDSFCVECDRELERLVLSRQVEAALEVQARAEQARRLRDKF